MQDFTITPTSKDEIRLKQEHNDRLKPTKPKNPKIPKALKKQQKKTLKIVFDNIVQHWKVHKSKHRQQRGRCCLQKSKKKSRCLS